MNNLKITPIQVELFWENRDDNIKMLDALLSDINTDIIILPEMFTSGFTMNVEENFDVMNGETITWMLKKSSELNAVICGSLIIFESGQYFNRFIWTQPDGELKWYDKKHLFAYAGEDKYYTPGQQRLIIEYKGWKILPLICYDLRFPVWSRNLEEYDLIIYVANWPQTRRTAWKALLQARAIENQSYVVGVNRVGSDGTGKVYSGDSSIISYSGEIINDYQNEVIVGSVVLEKEPLQKFRQDFPFLIDKDKFELI